MEKIEITQKIAPEDVINVDEVITETDLLPSDHPMMERFQKALKEHLLKIVDQLENEIVDINHAIQLKDDEIAEIGSKLFDRQNEIDKQRDTLDKYSKQILDISDKRKIHEDNVTKLKIDTNKFDGSCKESKRLNNEIAQQLVSMQFLESEITKWNNEIQNEIVLSKRMVQKDVKDQRIVSEEKKKMDLLLLHLDTELRRKEHELENVEQQIHEHNEEIICLNQSLADSNADLEGLRHETKKLMQAWGEIIVAVEKRDKILTKARYELE